MKTIGLIGGMSWESSKMYYEYINRKVQQELGGSHSGKILMVSVDFAEIEKFTFEGNWDAIADIVSKAALQLEKAGADIVLLCTNTIHLVSDAITSAITVPFLHIADATALEIKKRDIKKIGLLGTIFTMEKDFYKGYIHEKYGIEVIIPNASDRKIVQDIIYDELVKGQFNMASKEKCKLIIESLLEEGAEGIIMGCTELPILIPDSEVASPTFDTSKIHSHKAVEWALKKQLIT